MKLNNIAITGANGHVGATAARELLKQGYTVSGLIHENSNALQGLNINLVKGDITNSNSLIELFQGQDAVIHCAGYIGLERSHAKMMQLINVDGTRNIVNACLQSKVKKLVHVSSVQAFMSKKGVSLTENAEISNKKCDAYSYSKQLGEQEIRKAIAQGLNASIVNPTSILGPFDFNKGAQTKALLKIANRSLPVLMKGGFDWVDVRDVAQGIIGAMNYGKNGANYLLSGEWQSIQYIANFIGDWGKQKPIKYYVPILLAQFGAPFAEIWSKLINKTPLFTRDAIKQIKHAPCHVSHEKAGLDFSYKPRKLSLTLNDSLNWMNEQGWIK